MPTKSFSPRDFQGAIRIPGSKSQTIRAVLIALFARGTSTITGALESRDTEACFHVASQLGANLTFLDHHKTLVVDSTHLTPDPKGVSIDCMNSGTTLYLALCMLASLGIPVAVTGDEQLRKRPVKPLLDALRQLGVEVKGDELPCTIKGPIKGGSCSIECPTSQYLSGLLLGSVLAQGPVDIHVPLLYEKPYVGLTTGWLGRQCIAYECSGSWDFFHFPGRQKFTPFASEVPGDYSSASFFFALAALTGKPVTVTGLLKDDPQGDKRILDVLEAMGCTVVRKETEVTVFRTKPLKGGVFDLNDIPDTLPVLSVVATQAEGEVTFTNVAQARIKETDRIACMHQELEKLGAEIDEKPDGMTIHGGRPLHEALLSGHGDHRIIMALSILGSAVVPLEIDDTSAVDVTLPTFYRLLESLAS